MNKKPRWAVFVFVLALSCSISADGYLCAAPAKNVILLIGDGMGPAIIGISKNYNDFVLKRGPLNMEKLMNQGRVALMMTYSASHLVTDSAAGATAFACGVKTYNEAIGVDEKGNAVETILEKAKKAKKSVGVVTTTDLADATPAAFYAHAARRAQKQEIAKQGIENKKVDVMLGGGRQSFDLELAKQNGYAVLGSKNELENFRKKVLEQSSESVLGIFAEKELAYIAERTADVPTLPQMADLALALLQKNKDSGFFLMVEGGRIDHAGHANLAEKMVKEFLEFDEVVGLVLDYQKKNPDTLVLLTADHDCGGIALSKKEKGEEYPTKEQLANLEGVYWISGNHTACPVVLVGKGPGQEKVGGFKDNTDVYRILKESFGFK